MHVYSPAAWSIASFYSSALGPETWDLAGHIDAALGGARAENERLRGENTALRSNVVADRCKIERLRAALKPFAGYYDLNDCDKWHPDNVIEVPIRDLKVAWDTLNHEQSKDASNG